MTWFIIVKLQGLWISHDVQYTIPWKYSQSLQIWRNHDAKTRVFHLVDWVSLFIFPLGLLIFLVNIHHRCGLYIKTDRYWHRAPSLFSFDGRWFHCPLNLHLPMMSPVPLAGRLWLHFWVLSWSLYSTCGSVNQKQT